MHYVEPEERECNVMSAKDLNNAVRALAGRIGGFTRQRWASPGHCRPRGAMPRLLLSSVTLRHRRLSSAHPKTA